MGEEEGALRRAQRNGARLETRAKPFDKAERGSVDKKKCVADKK